MLGKTLKTLALLGSLSMGAALPVHAADPVSTVDFGDYEASAGSVDEWLEDKGFTFERAAKDPKKISLSFADGALQLDALKQVFGLFYKEAEVPGAQNLRVTWGVNDFPEGA